MRQAVEIVLGPVGNRPDEPFEEFGVHDVTLIRLVVSIPQLFCVMIGLASLRDLADHAGRISADQFGLLQA